MRKKPTTTSATQPNANFGALKPSKVSVSTATSDGITSYMVATASSTDTTAMRRNAASSIVRTDRYKNIDEGLIPFRYSSTIYGGNKSTLDVRDAVILCQKCYYNFATFRNIIDLMTEFSIGELYFRGGSKKSQDFFNALFKKINLWDFQDKWYREYFRSGNVFSYRYDSTIDPSDISRITQVFGADDKIILDLPVEAMQIPSKYVILNPADIHMVGTSNFGFGIYYQLLTAYQLARLKNPQTEEDKNVMESMSPEIQKQIMSGIQSVLVPLDIKKVSMIFYKKQDYEPFSVPMGYPVLEAINAKAEMIKIDMALARTMQQVILLVTTGAKPEDGGINHQNVANLKKLFENQSVGRVLISDYTTKAAFVAPDIAEFFNPQKYEVLEREINLGLNNVFAGDEKFANQQQKVEIFIARLEHAKQCFLTNFLIPEIKRIAQSLGMKNFPTPYFKQNTLTDKGVTSKIFARLIEMGVLTPEQGFEAIETNTMPDPESLVNAQTEYKKNRDAGLFTPLLNQKPAGGDAGRPDGATAPQTIKTVGPIGTSKANQTNDLPYSIEAENIVKNMVLAQELEEIVKENLKKIHKIKRFNAYQSSVAKDIVSLVMFNEEPDNWKTSANQYCLQPQDKNQTRVTEVTKFALTHQLDPYLAGISFASKVPNEVKS